MLSHDVPVRDFSSSCLPPLVGLTALAPYTPQELFMRRIASFAPAFAAGIVLSSLSAAAQTGNAASSKAIAVEPAVVAPGQPVTLRWYFTGDKVVVSGGRFGKGTVVTGKTLLKDTPTKTTQYKFNVWYKVPESSPDGQTTQKPIHIEYAVQAIVEKPVPISLKTYRDPYGWQVAHLLGWKFDKERLPDPANNALVFFQQEDDSVERLAVSILPVTDMDNGQLVSKIEKSLFQNYGEVQMGTPAEIRHGGTPAVLTTFTGMDNSHPGTRTQTLILAFVKDGRGYIVSARTNAVRFDFRRAALEKMVRSFSLIDKTAMK
jgi:hypothetical protein